MRGLLRLENVVRHCEVEFHEQWQPARIAVWIPIRVLQILGEVDV